MEKQLIDSPYRSNYCQNDWAIIVHHKNVWPGGIYLAVHVYINHVLWGSGLLS